MPRRVHHSSGKQVATARTDRKRVIGSLAPVSRATVVRACRAVAQTTTRPRATTVRTTASPDSPSRCRRAMTRVQPRFVIPSVRGAPANHTSSPVSASVRA